MQLFDKYINSCANKLVILLITPKYNNSEILYSYIDNKKNNDIHLIHVVEGNSFKILSESEVCLNFHENDQLQILKNYLKDKKWFPDIFLYNDSNGIIHGKTFEIDELLKNKFFKLHRLVILILSLAKENEIYFLSLYQLSNNLEEASSSAIDAYFQSITLENRNIKYKIIGLENNYFDPELIMNEVGFYVPNENHIKFIMSNRFVKRLKHTVSPMKTQSDMISTVNLGKKDTCIIVGGFGGIGFKIANYLIRNTKCNIIILGRKRINDELRYKLSLLEDEGGRAFYYSIDIGDKKQIDEVFDGLLSDHRVVDGVIYCAGITRDSFTINKKDQYITEVFKSKINGVINLDETLRNQKLKFFIIFTSLAGVVGNIGQSDYAYANSFLDNYVKLRNIEVANNLKYGHTQSIAWPYWENGGMFMPENAKKFLHDYVGMEPLSDEDGLKAFKHCLSEIEHNEFTFVLKKNNSFDVNHRNKRDKVKFNTKETSKLHDNYMKQSNFIDNLNLKSVTTEYLKNIFSKLTKIPINQIDLEKEYEHYGMDSVMIMDFNSLLSKNILNLPATVLYEYPTINLLINYLISNHKDDLIISLFSDSGKKSFYQKANQLSIENHRRSSEINYIDNSKIFYPHGIAVIGLSGIYPDAENIASFWENLVNGKNSISTVPITRWNHGQYFNENKNLLGHSYSKWGGFIKDPYLFDSLFFNISPNEARIIDPQERLFLEVAWKTIEDAGYTKDSLSSETVGVYVGAMWADYRLEGASPDYPTEYKRTKTSFSSIANRVSYFFDFHGPSVAFDTMCSSSLTSIYFACEGIAGGRIDYALAGGVNLALHPNKYILLSESNFASSDGLCKSFGSGGDGYVPGEGVGAVLLKPLSKAIADHDHIYAVIRAWEINHGGKVMGYTVPNPKAQADVVQRALKRSAVNPATINYIEAHGTGTNLGDPIEITGLCKAYEEFNLKPHSCAIGSVKSNIGHLEGAAGIAGLTKLVLQLKNKKLVPSLHSASLNPNIKFEQTPFFVNQELTDWVKPSQFTQEPRRGGVSAFGAGGSNAHLIVEEWDHDHLVLSNTETLVTNQYVVILSSKSKEQLIQQAKELRDYLKYNVNKIILKDIAYTLQIGRIEMDYRLAIITESINELQAALDDAISGTNNKMVFYGELSYESNTSKFKNKVINFPEYPLNEIVSYWIAGAKINWDSLYPEKPYKVSLPGFSFDKEYLRIPGQLGVNCIDDNQSGFESNLVDTNLGNQDNFSYKISSDNVLLKNHILNGKSIVPGALYLNIVSHCFRKICSFHSLEFKDIVFVKSLEGISDININVNFTLNGNIYSFIIIDELNETVTKGTICQINEKPNRYNSSFLSKEGFRASSELSSEDFYQKFSSVGIEYGRLLRGIGNIKISDDSAETDIVIGYHDLIPSKNELVDPYLLDCSFQSVSALITEERFAIPFMINELKVHGDLWKLDKIYAQCQKTNEIFNLYGVDDCDNVLLEIKKLVIRSLPVQLATNIKPKSYWRPEFKRIETPNEYVDGTCLIVTFKDNLDYLYSSIDFSGAKSDQITIYFSDKKRFFNLICSSDGKPYLTSTTITAFSSFERVIVLCMVTEKEYPLSKKIDFEKLFQEIELQFNTIKDIISSSKVTKLVYITNNVYSKDGSINNPVQGCFDALFKTISNEYPKIKFNSIDLLPNSVIPLGQIFFIHSQLVNKLVIYENGNSYIRFLNCNKFLNPIGTIKSKFKENGVYLIIGGSSGIGLELAKYLTSKYKAFVIITGTRKESSISNTLDLINNRSDGIITYYSVNLLNEESIKQFFHVSLKKYNKLDGIIHSANIKNDKLFFNLTGKEYVKDISISLKGTYFLSKLIENYELDFFIIFSSAQSLVGDVGLSNYATGSLFKDLYSSFYNDHSGPPVKLIDWGYWNEVGMMNDSKYKSVMERKGILPISNKEGMEVIEQALLTDGLQFIYIKTTEQGLKNLGWDESIENESVDFKIPILASDEEEKLSSSIEVVISNSLTSESSNSLIKDKIQKFLIATFSKVLGIHESKLLSGKTFDEYGIDSIIITQLTNVIREKFNTISSTILFEHNTIGNLSEHLSINFSEEAAEIFNIRKNDLIGPTHEGNKDEPILNKTDFIDKSNHIASSVIVKKEYEIKDFNFSDSEIDEILF